MSGIDMLGFIHALDDDDLLGLLRSRVRSARGQSAFARQYGVKRTYWNMVLNGKKQPGGPSILDALGLRIAYVCVGQRGRADADVFDRDDVLKLLHSRVKERGQSDGLFKAGRGKIAPEYGAQRQASVVTEHR